jgi:hypothetical protein
VFSGLWNNGEIKGRGIFIEKFGSKWIGNWNNNLLNGIGIEINSEYYYEGDYVNGFR